MIKKQKHFAAFFSSVIYSKEWKQLTKSEMVLYLYLKCGFNNNNNGEITLPYSNLRDVMSSKTFSCSIKGLIDKQWVQKSKAGGLFEKASHYKLTFLFDKKLGKK